MTRDVSLLKTSIELIRERRRDNGCHYKLVLGGNPSTSVVITNSNLKNLLKDLPVFLSNIVHSQIQLDNPKHDGGLIL